MSKMTGIEQKLYEQLQWMHDKLVEHKQSADGDLAERLDYMIDESEYAIEEIKEFIGAKKISHKS